MRTEQKQNLWLIHCKIHPTIPIKLVVFRGKLKAVQFSDELKPFRDGPFSIFNKPAEVTYEFIIEEGKKFPTEKNHFFLYSPEETLFFPHIQSYHEQNPGTTHDSDISDMIQNELYTSHEFFEFG